MLDLKINAEDLRTVKEYRECWLDLHKLHERREFPGCCPFCAEQLQTDFDAKAVEAEQLTEELDEMTENWHASVTLLESSQVHVEQLKTDLEEAEQSHCIDDLESRIAIVKECLSGIEWQGLTISVNHRSNVDRAILALRDIVPSAKDNANA